MSIKYNKIKYFVIWGIILCHEEKNAGKVMLPRERNPEMQVLENTNKQCLWKMISDLRLSHLNSKITIKKNTTDHWGFVKIDIEMTQLS